MTTAMPGAAPVISGWAVTSPYGRGVEAFRDGVTAGRSAVRALPGGAADTDPWPFAGWVPDFDIRVVLGRKGTRAMDRLTALAVATTGEILGADGAAAVADDPETVGFVLGSDNGSVRSVIEFMRDSYTSEKPYHVDPSVIPNSGMNAAAGRNAIWHGLQGPNVTVSGGPLSALLSLNYAVRLLRRGRAEVVLAGAAEEYSTHRAWLTHHAQPAGGLLADGPLGEGCVMLLVESAQRAARHGRPVLAEVLASRFAAFGPSVDAATAVRRAVTDVVKHAGVTTDRIGLVVSSDRGGSLGAAEDEAVTAALDGHRPARVRLRELIGDVSSASAAFQVAAALVCAEPGTAALVTSVDPDGTAGCTLLGLPAST